MLKIVVSLLVTVLFLGISFCKENNQSKVDKLQFFSEPFPKTFKDDYKNALSFVTENFHITKKALQSGGSILEMSQFSDITRKLINQRDWLANIINPNSPWKAPNKWILKDVNKLQETVHKFFESPEILAEMIDIYYATQSKGLHDRLGLKAKSTLRNRIIDTIELPDSQALALSMDNLNKDLKSRGIREEYLFINVPQEMRLRNIESRSDKEYLSNLANKGTFELNQMQATLGGSPYRVHQLLAITPEIYNQNRVLAQKATAYIDFMENLIESLRRAKDNIGEAEALASLNHFKEKIQSAIDKNLKNAGEIQFFLSEKIPAHKNSLGKEIPEKTLLDQFLPTTDLQIKYLESMYDVSFFNVSFEQVLKRLVIEPSKERTGSMYTRIRENQMKLFLEAHPEIEAQKAIMFENDSVQGIFKRALKRKAILETAYKNN